MQLGQHYKGKLRIGILVELIYMQDVRRPFKRGPLVTGLLRGPLFALQPRLRRWASDEGVSSLTQ